MAAAGAAVSVATTGLIVRNMWKIPRVAISRDPVPNSPESLVSVLVPARNEAINIGGCLESIIGQQGVYELLVLDDDSTDATGDIASNIVEAARDIVRARLIRSAQPVPANWLGKPWACQRLAEAASGDVLVFIDADVRLEPDAIRASVALMREYQLDMLCPYPRQLVRTPLTRLIQPLLQWSWMAMIPGSFSMRRQPPSMAVGNGQFAIFDAAAYWAVGGHRTVATNVLEDVGMARTLRREGFRTAVVDGSSAATCRMYNSDRELLDGYSKSLWCAFGNGASSTVAVTGLLVASFVVPPVIALLSRDRYATALGVLGYGAAVIGRLLVARNTGQKAVPDSFGHPLSIIAFTGITAVSIHRRSRGAITWKDRTLPA
jgi:hypothetical protein